MWNEKAEKKRQEKEDEAERSGQAHGHTIWNSNEDNLVSGLCSFCINIPKNLERWGESSGAKSCRIKDAVHLFRDVRGSRI